MNKRVPIFLLSLITLSILAITLVSAVPETSSIISGIQDFISPLLEAVFGESTQIFEQLLFALLIIAAVYMALSRVEIIQQNAFALWTITIVSAILAVRFIATQKLIDLVLLPQGAFGVAMLTIIPFAIYFWFIEFGLAGTGSRVLRKMGWIVYAVVWAVLWYKQVYGTPVTEIPGQWVYLYLIVAVVAVIIMLADGTIQNAIRKSKATTHKESQKEVLIDKIIQEMEEVQENIVKATTDASRKVYEDRLKTLEKRLDRIQKV